MKNSAQIKDLLSTAAPIPPEEIPKFFEMLAACHRESELSSREMKKIDAMKEVMIAEISAKYKLYEDFFDRLFAERREAVHKDFEVIDRGVRENKRELVAEGLQGLSDILTANPLAGLSFK